ncbi:LysR family transcriptional regulator [Nonomuraea sp. SMC257]|uniref:LysR family transcriptional regulator n=1 Tax=Nonomuraea montanisoli TaxID=2741721 RepID=A0A7Y6M1B0_9ACTN|nr:LysR family transcriptional regulator [Nonomuraea montanisoli]NUW30857.1 LysR family transcriptional regulator [Nonomuraea montanisoli]
MELRLLRAFIETARLGAFGRAAQELCVTQPALTKQIQALEAEIGGLLFDRGRHGAALTPLGQMFLPDAQDLVRRADILTRRARQTALGERGLLSVGFGMSTIDLAPRAVAAFRRRYPHVEITLDDMSGATQTDLIRAGRLHVGFVRLPVDDDLGAITLRTDTLAIAVTCDEGPAPLSDQSVVSWLADRPLIRLASAKGPGLAAQVDGFLGAYDLRPHILQEAHDLQTVVALVASGAGVAIVPASAVTIASPAVTIVPIELPPARWQVGAVWDRAHMRPVTANFLAVVRELVPSAPRGDAEA